VVVWRCGCCGGVACGCADSGGKEAPPPYDEAIHMCGCKESEGDVEAAELAATASAVAAQAVAAAIARTASLGAMAGADNGDSGCAASKADVAPASTEPSRVAGAGAGSGAGAGGASEAQGDGASEGKAADEHPVVALTRSCKALRKFVKLVVWDFDLTVLSIHSFASRIEPHHVPHRNLGVDFVDLPMYVAAWVVCGDSCTHDLLRPVGDVGSKHLCVTWLTKRG